MREAPSNIWLTGDDHQVSRWGTLFYQQFVYPITSLHGIWSDKPIMLLAEGMKMVGLSYCCLCCCFPNASWFALIHLWNSCIIWIVRTRTLWMSQMFRNLYGITQLFKHPKSFVFSLLYLWSMCYSLLSATFINKILQGINSMEGLSSWYIECRMANILLDDIKGKTGIFSSYFSRRKDLYSIISCASIQEGFLIAVAQMCLYPYLFFIWEL